MDRENKGNEKQKERFSEKGKPHMNIKFKSA